MDNLRLLYFEFKNMRWKYFVPLIIIYIMVPLLSIRYAATINFVSDAATLIVPPVYTDFERYIPIIAVWYFTLCFREYSNQGALELVKAYGVKQKSDLIKTIFIWLHTVALVGVLLIGYSFYMDNMFVMFIKIIIQMLFYLSFQYFVVKVTNSVLVPAIIITTYHLIFNFVYTKISIWNIFIYYNEITKSVLLNKYGLLALMSLAMLIVGMNIDRKSYDE